MAKTKTRKSILKAVAAGFACMMCCAFFPANAIANAADYTGDAANANVSRISVNGEGQTLRVKEGTMVTVPAASYTHAGTTYKFEDLTSDAMKASTKVVYKGTGEEVAITEGKFAAARVGTYVITYTVEKDGIPYSYDMSVVAEATEVSFDFEANTSSVIPSVYDVTYAEGKDVELPLPTVFDADKEEILKNAAANFTTENDTSAITGDMYVNISLTNGGEGVAISDKEVDGQKVFYIKGSDISKKSDGTNYDYEGKEFKVIYSFYQKVGSDFVYVDSTSKTFTVKSNYYYKTDAKDANARGYELDGAFSTTFPDSASVGIEKTLPSVVATTKAKNSPAGEIISVYYSIQVLKMDENAKYTIDVTADTITDGNKFTAKEEGSYKFIYTAKDFYGNEVDKDTVTRTITNVKDTISASVFMYDAVNPGYDAEKKTYQSAENLLKTKGLNRNIIIYAIGGTDNMVENDKIELRREIRTYGGTTVFSIDQKEYDAYNLVFAPTLTADTTGMSQAEKENALYKQIVDENFALRSQILLEGKDAEDPAVIKAHMAGKYLLVTTEFNKDAFGNELVAGLSEDDEEALSKMMDKGYAYIPAEEKQNATFSNSEYTVRYFANDKVNNNTETRMAAKSIEFVKDFTDEAVPTLTFSSDLQAAYLPTDSFTFKAASATDTPDGRISATTAYRYLDENKDPVDDENAKGELSYFVQRYDTEKVKDKWYAQTGATPAAHAEGWYVEKGAESYTVDLSKKPTGAVYVEIFAYATDDYGNTGFFNKLVKIADATDLNMPTLVAATTVDQTYTAPDEIKLPTLTFSDDKVDFMTCEVAVYKVTKDAQGKVSKKYISSYGKNGEPDSYLKQYTVEGGYFRASVAGEYQVAITVKDAGNHSITSFFNYSVAEGSVDTLAPTIDNITSAEESLKPGVPLYLDPPSISMTKEEAFGYIGVEEDDDSNAATWYNVSAISATSNNYEIENNTYFTAYSEGTYKLQYTAYLLKYSKAAVESGDLKIVDGQLQDKDGKIVFLNKRNDFKVALLAEDGTITNEPASLVGLVEGYAIKNDSVITVTVSSATLSINESKMNLHYKGKTEYDKNDKIEIVKPTVEFDGDIETDAEKSTVTITKNSTTLATIKLSDWAKTEGISLKDYFEITADGKILLVMNDDGKYTITYKVVGTGKAGATASDSYTATLSAGDVVGPELELGDELVEAKYNVGDSLRIAFSNTTIDESVLSTSDLVTKDVEKLLKTLVVKVKYEDGSYETLKNQATEEGYYDYSYDLEKKGTYTLSFAVTDEAGNTTTKYKEIEVGSQEASTVDAKEVIGGVLIGLSVALLAGVVIYFVVSKKKLDKKEKSYRKDNKSKR